MKEQRKVYIWNETNTRLEEGRLCAKKMGYNQVSFESIIRVTANETPGFLSFKSCFILYPSIVNSHAGRSLKIV